MDGDAETQRLGGGEGRANGCASLAAALPTAPGWSGQPLNPQHWRLQPCPMHRLGRVGKGESPMQPPQGSSHQVLVGMGVHRSATEQAA